MTEDSYLRWLVNETPTAWWHDSGDPDELRQGLAHGAAGVTTNPVLAAAALTSHPEKWAAALRDSAQGSSPAERAELLMRAVVANAAKMFLPVYERTGRKHGYVCAQVNPAMAGERAPMLQMARRLHAWAPNIAVKLPATAAGLDVLEDCAAEGISVTATVSFTVPQVVAVAERYRRGLERARKVGIELGRCFAVVMIGRLDDYLREVAHDRKADVTESDIRQAGIAVTKRAYSLYKERRYEAVLLVAALRGTHHMEALAGAELIMSIHPKVQVLLLQPGVAREPNGIAAPVPLEVVRRLERIPEFARAYDPEGMTPEEFIMYGVTQRTLSQFLDAGWARMEALQK